MVTMSSALEAGASAEVVTAAELWAAAEVDGAVVLPPDPPDPPEPGWYTAGPGALYCAARSVPDHG